MTPAEIHEAALAARQVVEARTDRLLADADLADALCTVAAHVLENGAVAVCAGSGFRVPGTLVRALWRQSEAVQQVILSYVHLLVKEKRSRVLTYVLRFNKLQEGRPPELVATGLLTVVCVAHDRTGKMEAVAIPEALASKISVAPAEILNR